MRRFPFVVCQAYKSESYPDFGIAVSDRIDGGTECARLTKEQLDRLRDYLKKYRVDDLPSLEQKIYDGIGYHYLHASMDDIQQFSMNNPPTGRSSGFPSAQNSDGDEEYSEGIVIYGQLVNLFDDLFDEMKIGEGDGD